MSEVEREQLMRERQRALRAESALAAARRENDILALRNAELAGIVDALLTNTRPTWHASDASRIEGGDA